MRFHAKYPLFDSQSDREFTFSYAILTARHWILRKGERLLHFSGQFKKLWSFLFEKKGWALFQSKIPNFETPQMNANWSTHLRANLPTLCEFTYIAVLSIKCRWPKLRNCRHMTNKLVKVDSAGNIGDSHLRIALPVLSVLCYRYIYPHTFKYPTEVEKALT